MKQHFSAFCNFLRFWVVDPFPRRFNFPKRKIFVYGEWNQCSENDFFQKKMGTSWIVRCTIYKIIWSNLHISYITHIPFL